LRGPERNLLDRCLAVARNTDPSRIHKTDLTGDDFDEALQQLADSQWDAEHEPAYRAYARAFESPDGMLLYAAREWARIPDPPAAVRKREPATTKTERRIHALASEYQRQHPGTLHESAVCKVLERDPDLYARYMSECE
jgi:hypothetical protein